MATSAGFARRRSPPIDRTIAREFEATAIQELRSGKLIVDVRQFGGRQVEAVDFTSTRSPKGRGEEKFGPIANQSLFCVTMRRSSITRYWTATGPYGGDRL